MALKGLKKLFKFSNDGTQNDEHILDMIGAVKVKYENLQGNTDIAVTTIEKEMARKERDYDMVDAIILLGQEILSYEKEGKIVIDDIEKIEEAIKSGASVENEKVQLSYDKLRDLEKLSKYKLENMIKATEDSERERRKRARMAKKQKVTKNQENENKSGNEKPSDSQNGARETGNAHKGQDASLKDKDNQVEEKMPGENDENIVDLEESESEKGQELENDDMLDKTQIQKEKTTKRSNTFNTDKKGNIKKNQTAKSKTKKSPAKSTDKQKKSLT